MSGADKKGSGAPAAKNPDRPSEPDGLAEEEAVESPEYIVTRGHTVRVDGRTIGPGMPVTLSAEDAEWLLSSGFIVDAAAEASTGGGVAVGGLKIMGGRKPGGVVPR
jgi:hypothetical protein